MGNGAWGMGHGAWGIGHGAWGMGHGYKDDLRQIPTYYLQVFNRL